MIGQIGGKDFFESFSYFVDLANRSILGKSNSNENTYLLFVHYEFITGVISEGELHEKNTILKQFLESHENKALNIFALEMYSTD